jgi:hypothetical protein
VSPRTESEISFTVEPIWESLAIARGRSEQASGCADRSIARSHGCDLQALELMVPLVLERRGVIAVQVGIDPTDGSEVWPDEIVQFTIEANRIFCIFSFIIWIN